jgi:hypothetical protein
VQEFTLRAPEVSPPETGRPEAGPQPAGPVAGHPADLGRRRLAAAVARVSPGPRASSGRRGSSPGLERGSGAGCPGWRPGHWASAGPDEVPARTICLDASFDGRHRASFSRLSRTAVTRSVAPVFCETHCLSAIILSTSGRVAARAETRSDMRVASPGRRERADNGPGSGRPAIGQDRYMVTCFRQTGSINYGP